MSCFTAQGGFFLILALDHLAVCLARPVQEGHSAKVLHWNNLSETRVTRYQQAA